MARLNEFHIVVFTDTFFETNGVASYYRMLLDWSRSTPGVRVTIVCPKRHDLEGAEYGHDVIPIQGSVQFRNPFYKDLVLGYFSGPAVRKILQNLSGPKVVHIATSGAVGVTGATVARKMGLPVVGYYHTDLPHYGKLYGESLAGRLGGWIGLQVALTCERLAFAKCDMMCVPSETAGKTARMFFEGPIRVIPNPVPVRRFQPAASRQGSFRQKYAADGRVLAVVVGRIAKEKNLDLICELLIRDPRIALVFVGDGPYAATLRQRWGATITGFLRGQALLDAFQQADALVQLSESETFGLALVEAMASGLPAFVLRSQGFVANLEGECGVDVLERGDLPELADRCVALVRDAERHARAGEQARQFVQSISSEVIFPRLSAYHRQALGREQILESGYVPAEAVVAPEAETVSVHAV
ncbi:MAG: glycosyltransferase [Phycisphaerae bacterium]|nr:glycosyltransferase [Phycisphaerae bacterium]